MAILIAQIRSYCKSEHKFSRNQLHYLLSFDEVILHPSAWAHTYIHTRVHAHANAHVHKHTYTHLHKHTYTHVHTHTYTHVHTHPTHMYTRKGRLRSTNMKHIIKYLWNLASVLLRVSERVINDFSNKDKLKDKRLERRDFHAFLRCHIT